MNNKILSLLRIGVLFSSLFVISCNRSRVEVAPNFADSGSIQFASSIPQISSEIPSALVGFLPIVPGILPTENWISIEVASGKISLMKGERSLRNYELGAVPDIAPGEYQVLHKQRNALWYAPDNYFTERDLPVPNTNDRARFRRGALGEYAIFILKDLPIHSGPEWTDEVNGIRVDEGKLAEIYYALDVGSTVEVK